MFQTYQDRVTGRTVTKLTPDGTLCHQPYFYNRMFTADGTKLVYAREENGVRGLWMLNLTDGISRCLTEESGIDTFGVNLSADESAIIYSQNNSVFRQSLSTGEKTVLYATPEGWKGYSNPSLSSDDRRLVTVELRNEDIVHSNSSWDTFEEQWRKNPLSRIVLVDLQSGASEVIFQQDCWLGHPQLRPHHDSDISFCHEGPARRIDARLWMIHSDGSGMHCLRPQEKGELITHEFWLADGSRLAFIYRRQLEEDAEVTGVKQSILLLDTDTGKEEFVMDCSVYCHSITDHTGRYLVGDGQDAREPYIFLTDLKEKKERILCAHDTSWKSYGNTQDAHPHPVFTPDGSKVLFTSDRDGLPGIYLTTVE